MNYSKEDNMVSNAGVGEVGVCSSIKSSCKNPFCVQIGERTFSSEAGIQMGIGTLYMGGGGWGRQGVLWTARGHP